MAEDKQWWKGVRALTNRDAAPMVAVLFWFLAGLLVLLAMARSKDNPLSVLIEGVGAVGQVAFAFLVWRLSKEQFAFTKTVSDRQHRIDAYVHRKGVFDKLDALEDRFINPINIDHYVEDELESIFREVQRMFSIEATDLSFSLYDTAATINGFRSALWSDSGRPIGEERVNKVKDIEEVSIEAANLYFALRDQLDNEMNLLVT
jgi:hypothetical protein